MKDCDECVAGCKAIYHMDVEKVESLGEGLLVISSLSPTFTLENEFLCLSAASETIENVHASYPRNKNLAFAFYKAGFIESWGRGWQKICDGFTAAGLPKPTIETSQGGVLVSFQRNNVNLSKQKTIDAQNVGVNVAVNVAEKLTERQRIIIELIEKGVVDDVAQNVAVNTRYLSKKLNVNRKTIQRDMAYLQERKLIQWVGPDKGGHWEIIIHEEGYGIE